MRQPALRDARVLRDARHPAPRGPRRRRDRTRAQAPVRRGRQRVLRRSATGRARTRSGGASSSRFDERDRRGRRRRRARARPRATSEPQVYLPYQQVDDGAIIGLHAEGPGRARVRRRRRRCCRRCGGSSRSADPEQPISDVRTADRDRRRRDGAAAVQVRVLGGFAALAFLLAGDRHPRPARVRGLAADARDRRAASRSARSGADILGMVLRRGAASLAIGVAFGVALASPRAAPWRRCSRASSPADAATFARRRRRSAVVMTLAGKPSAGAARGAGRPADRDARRVARKVLALTRLEHVLVLRVARDERLASGPSPTTNSKPSMPGRDREERDRAVRVLARRDLALPLAEVEDRRPARMASPRSRRARHST